MKSEASVTEKISGAKLRPVSRISFGCLEISRNQKRNTTSTGFLFQCTFSKWSGCVPVVATIFLWRDPRITNACPNRRTSRDKLKACKQLSQCCVCLSAMSRCLVAVPDSQLPSDRAYETKRSFSGAVVHKSHKSRDMHCCTQRNMQTKRQHVSKCPKSCSFQLPVMQSFPGSKLRLETLNQFVSSLGFHQVIRRTSPLHCTANVLQPSMVAKHCSIRSRGSVEALSPLRVLVCRKKFKKCVSEMWRGGRR